MKRIAQVALLAIIIAIPLGAARAAAPPQGDWKAGIATADITPESSMLMAGYPNRQRYGTHVINNLSAKTIVLEDSRGRRGVIVTLDLEGIARDLSQSICEELKTRHGLERSQILIACSHTHSGPVVGHNLRPMHYDLASERDRKEIDQYAARLQRQIVKLVGQAVADLKPVRLAWGNGKATFAANRRNNVESEVPRLRQQGTIRGPVDHDVPVISARRSNGQLVAVVFGYACHAAVLSGNGWSSDFPGFAQTELEKRHPGCAALFITGCAGDQNPLPRGRVDQAQQYGRDLAAAVDAALATTMTPLAARLETSYREIELPFGALPSKLDVERDAASRHEFTASRAKAVLRQFRPDGKLPENYPYPVAVWRLGSLTLAALGGEAVVDYSLRLKTKLGPMWVAAYSNDVMAYIPSRRVLVEGGYEGGGSMLYYGLPAPWGLQTEELIIHAARGQIADTAAE